MKPICIGSSTPHQAAANAAFFSRFRVSAKQTEAPKEAPATGIRTKDGLLVGVVYVMYIKVDAGGTPWGGPVDPEIPRYDATLGKAVYCGQTVQKPSKRCQQHWDEERTPFDRYLSTQNRGMIGFAIREWRTFEDAKERDDWLDTSEENAIADLETFRYADDGALKTSVWNCTRGGKHDRGWGRRGSPITTLSYAASKDIIAAEVVFSEDVKRRASEVTCEIALRDFIQYIKLLVKPFTDKTTLLSLPAYPHDTFRNRNQWKGLADFMSGHQGQKKGKKRGRKGKMVESRATDADEDDEWMLHESTTAAAKARKVKQQQVSMVVREKRVHTGWFYFREAGKAKKWYPVIEKGKQTPDGTLAKIRRIPLKEEN